MSLCALRPPMRVVVLIVVLCLLCVPRCFGACAGTACFTTGEAENTLNFLQSLGSSLGQGTWTGSNFCDWTGVACGEGGVTVFLGSAGVLGTLAELDADVDGAQVRVFRIDVSNNPLITGTLPASWGRLTQAQQVDVTRCGIRGSLPVEWKGMASLTDLMVFSTGISGTIPAEWAALGNLIHFAAQNTQISGPVPPEWGIMRGLRHFLAYETQLSGTLPQEWGAMTQLQYFAVLSTSVAGTLPPSWGNWTQVIAVRLEDTQVTGTLPPEWSTMTALTEFSAEKTRLYGTIPDAWGALSSLNSVALPETEVTCCLPYRWICEKEWTIGNVGLDSQASQECPSKETVCSSPESSYTSGCPAYTPTSTTTTAPPRASDGHSASNFPWWAILLVVVLSVGVVLLVLLLMWCCCLGGGTWWASRMSAQEDKANASASVTGYETVDDVSAELETRHVESPRTIHVPLPDGLNPFVAPSTCTQHKEACAEALTTPTSSRAFSDEDDDCVVPFSNVDPETERTAAQQSEQ